MYGGSSVTAEQVQFAADADSGAVIFAGKASAGTGGTGGIGGTGGTGGTATQDSDLSTQSDPVQPQNTSASVSIKQLDLGGKALVASAATSDQATIVAIGQLSAGSTATNPPTPPVASASALAVESSSVSSNVGIARVKKTYPRGLCLMQLLPLQRLLL